MLVGVASILYLGLATLIYSIDVRYRCVAGEGCSFSLSGWFKKYSAYWY